MGRAFRVLKRTAHLTVHVSERPQKAVAVAAGETKKRARTPKKAAKE
jgi:ribosomal protein L22